jgi:hypothetical protein
MRRSNIEEGSRWWHAQRPTHSSLFHPPSASQRRRRVPKNKELLARLVRSVSWDGDKLDILTATHHFTSLLLLNRHLCKLAAATKIHRLPLKGPINFTQSKPILKFLTNFLKLTKVFEISRYSTAFLLHISYSSCRVLEPLEHVFQL